MEISDVIKIIQYAAEQYSQGLIGMIDIEEIALTSIARYTQENFVYTGDIPVTYGRNCG
jgi:hypothetical protein